MSIHSYWCLCFTCQSLTPLTLQLLLLCTWDWETVWNPWLTYSLSFYCVLQLHLESALVTKHLDSLQTNPIYLDVFLGIPHWAVRVCLQSCSASSLSIDFSCWLFGCSIRNGRSNGKGSVCTISRAMLLDLLEYLDPFRTGVSVHF